MQVYNGKLHFSVDPSYLQAIGRKLTCPTLHLLLPDYSVGIQKYSVGYTGSLLRSGLTTEGRTVFLEAQPYTSLT